MHDILAIIKTPKTMIFFKMKKPHCAITIFYNNKMYFSDCKTIFNIHEKIRAKTFWTRKHFSAFTT